MSKLTFIRLKNRKINEYQTVGGPLLENNGIDLVSTEKNGFSVSVG